MAQAPEYGSPKPPPDADELAKEFVLSFIKLWEQATAKPKKANKGKGPTNCPEGLKEMCEVLHEWARKWKIWGDAVHERLWPPGSTDPPDPPPDSPFV